MQVNLDSLNCNICYSTIEDAVSCESCGNSFCSKCANDYERATRKSDRTLKCPMCNNKYFRRKKNPLVNELIRKIINGQRTYKCKKCNRIFLEEKKYIEHLNGCSNIKCCSCGKIFKDEDTFLNHFNDKNNFQEKLYVCTFLLNSNLKNVPTDFFQKSKTQKKNFNFNEVEPVESETTINKYSNYLEKEPKPSNYNIIKENNCESLLNTEYDLVYCGRYNNQINGKKCKPGNELCLNCMKINQGYHGLKKHYLINCAGRVCTYSKGSVHCNCKFEKEMKHDTGRLFSYDFVCSDKNDVCQACQIMNTLLNKYLDKKIIDALYKRDKLSGF